MKTLMLGNEAVARGLYEAGCTFVSSYPGTPSTEITEFAATYDDIYAEWAPNEKTAVEASLGAAIVGARSFSAMKHVGLNVAADPLFSGSYAGVNAGLVIAVADDPGMHSSQDEQDSRHYAIAAKCPMLEPADSQECADFVAAAYEISEAYDTPVLLRLTTRISHSQSIVETKERACPPLREYVKQAGKYVVMPAVAKKRHIAVEERMEALSKLGLCSGVNKIIRGSDKIGVIASGISFQYAREALGENASYLKLGVVNPLPMDIIKEFAASVEKLYVVEELDPVYEGQIRAAGIEVTGGKELFTLQGEYTASMIKKRLLGEEAFVYADENMPGRPPVLCPGCPHRATFYMLHKLKLNVSGDIGCYTLGATPPLNAVDTTIEMGGSIGLLHGMNTARKDFSSHAVAVIGDSTFMHSGMTALLNMVYNQSASTVLILDNSITGMTGHQQNPATGLTLKNKPAPALDFEALSRAMGVKRVFTVDPYDFEALESRLKEEIAADEVSVIICKRPCMLLKWVKPAPPLKIDASKCKKCRMCMAIGCPAIHFSPETGAAIDETLCVGCGLCKNMCKAGCIE